MEIQERLRTRGLDLSNKRLGEIFRNPFYCGRISHSLLGDRIVKENHPQIVSEEVFERINGAYRTDDRYIQQEETPEYQLRIFIKCSECGFFLTGYEVKKKGLHYYKCNTKGCRCNVSAKKLHEQFIDQLKQYTLLEEIIPIVREIMLNVLKECSESSEQRKQELKSLQSSLRKQKEEVAVRFGLGNIPEDVSRIIDTCENKNRSRRFSSPKKCLPEEQKPAKTFFQPGKIPRIRTKMANTFFRPRGSAVMMSFKHFLLPTGPHPRLEPSASIRPSPHSAQYQTNTEPHTTQKRRSGGAAKDASAAATTERRLHSNRRTESPDAASAESACP